MMPKDPFLEDDVHRLDPIEQHFTGHWDPWPGRICVASFCAVFVMLVVKLLWG